MANEILTPAYQMVSGANLPTEGGGFLPAVNQATAVASALQRFDRDKARTLNEAVTGDGTAIYDLSASLSAAWDEDSSAVVLVDYPYTLGDDNIVTTEKWKVVDAPTTGKTLYFTESTPAATETIRVEFSSPWTEATVPSAYRYSVAKLAAANMARMIGARMAQSNDSTIAADTFSNNSAARDWTNIAKEYESQYVNELGLGKDSTVKAACGSVQVNEGSGTGYGKVHDYIDD